MFRPCIDLHEGKVKQIVGGSLEDAEGGLRTNFIADRPPEWYAALYRRDDLKGGHVIKLGPGNDTAARSALAAYPGGLQIGGGIHSDNAREWLDAGASHLIVTSFVFREGRVDRGRLEDLEKRVGRRHLVLDLSCRLKDDRYFIVTDRWRNFTEVELTPATLAEFSNYCDEFLIHAVDVEGLCRGIDERLVQLLAASCPIPSTYAGGARSIKDLERVDDLGRGRVHLTIGSALDIFGGHGVTYADAVAFNRRARHPA